MGDIKYTTLNDMISLSRIMVFETNCIWSVAIIAIVMIL